MDLIVQIKALQAAVQQLGAKTPIGSKLRSADWEKMPLALRQAGQFSAGVEDVRFLRELQDKLNKAISLTRERVQNGEAFVDRSSFVGDMRKLALQSGLSESPNPFADMGITNIASPARLKLIYDMQVQGAQGHARWKDGNDADALDAFPAQELIREEERDAPRNWQARWEAAGAKVNWVGASKTSMVALKTSPIWAALSRFGQPWPPFDFQSGMGVRDISRDEAEAAGLLAPGETVEPTAEADYAASMKASVAGLTAEDRAALVNLFGNQIAIEGDTVRWIGRAA